MQRPDISILVVSWNTSALLSRCLESVRSAVRLSHEVIVVDNASDDDSVALVRERHPEVRLIALEENVGFSRGNNRAMEGATGRYLLLLNPDTEVRPGALEDLVGFLDRNPDVGIAGPTLWNPDGTHQPSTRPFPTLRNEFLRATMLWRLFPTAALRRARRNEEDRPDEVSGAALCIRRECLERIGPMDEGNFMYYEDTDWCRRARSAGWEVAYRPGPGIVHVRWGASRGAARARTIVTSQRSAERYFRKHHGDASIAGLRLVALLGGSVRLVRAAVEWLVGIERADRAARMSAYRSILAWAAFGTPLADGPDA
ncbi:glycosyltransferase family 2 protein [bacterium]|nr:glycosyltransferase family 2 protein [bacterium]